jgi:phosphoglycolate phosphatase
MIEKLPKAIILDWDNTIIESWEMLHICINHVLKTLNKEEWTLEKIKNSIHFSMRDFFPSIFNEQAEEATALFRKKYHEIKASHLNYIPDVEKFLQFFFDKRENKQIFLAILSNKTGAYLRSELEQLNLIDKFDMVIGAGDCEEDKPSVIPVKLILAKFKVAPQDVWFIGDSIVDIECANKSGCIPILFGDKSINDNIFNVYKPQFAFSNYNDFYEAIQRLENV